MFTALSFVVNHVVNHVVTRSFPCDCTGPYVDLQCMGILFWVIFAIIAIQRFCFPNFWDGIDSINFFVFLIIDVFLSAFVVLPFIVFYVAGFLLSCSSDSFFFLYNIMVIEAGILVFYSDDILDSLKD